MPSHIALPTDDALLCQRIEMWRVDLLWMLRIELHIRVAEVICDDNDDVGLCRSKEPGAKGEEANEKAFHSRAETQEHDTSDHINLKEGWLAAKKTQKPQKQKLGMIQGHSPSG